ncbi:hypothetical protein G7074_02090 [Pedobacter sp. HDW13]|uniref:TonB-dependent receptor n=1 Tax=Pedobacter sp. HDW13 TaxID=2714940 RepID=UPI00140C0A8C|nr:Plug and carboxypeptidase regulatory-like domain-containing protein [Pedobacter sp. HDW13]QIL38170.1 hypothetical protein G7074_02090 [Pedobacter sp. HDW13]
MKEKVFVNTAIKFCIAFMCLFISMGNVRGQIISGEVASEKGGVIQNANVVAMDSLGNTIGYSFTDSKGVYKLKVIENRMPFILNVYAFNFESITRKIFKITTREDFTLKVKAIDLKEVNVKAPPVSSKGDTISYDVDFFKKAQNRVIGDVLKNIPGIDIDAKGQISYNGMAINKFYIDGDDILGGRYNLAENTIPADMVEKVQILERHQPIAVLRNVAPSISPALNLKLKTTAKFRLVGEAEIGVGTKNNFLANANTMLLKQKFKTINRIGFNSTALVYSEELIDHSLNAYLDRNNTPFSTPIYATQNLVTPEIGLSRWFTNYSGIANINTLINLAEKQVLRINIGYVPEKNKRAYSFENNYFSPNGFVKQFESQDLQNSLNTIRTNFEFEKNSEQVYVQNKLVTDFDINKAEGKLYTDRGSLLQLAKQRNNNLNNTISIIKLLGRGLIVNLRNKSGYTNNPEDDFISDNLFITGNSIPSENLQQRIKKQSYYLTNRGSITYGTKNLKPSLTLGYNIARSIFESKLNTIDINTEYVNNLSFVKSQKIITPGITYMADKFRFEAALPLTYETIRSTDKLRGNRIDTSIFKPLVNLNLTYAFKGKNTLGLNYNSSLNTSQPMDILQGSVLKNYRTLSNNDFFIVINQSRYAGLYYRYQNTLKIFFASISFDYSGTKSNSITQNDISPGGVINLKRIMLPNSIHRYSLKLDASKYIFGLKTTLKPSLVISLLKQPVFQNGSLLNGLNNSITANMSFDGKPVEFFNFNFLFTSTIVDVKTFAGQSAGKYRNYYGSGKLNLAFKPSPKFICETFQEYQFFNGNIGKSKYFMSDVKLTYLNNSRTSFNLQLINAFNNKDYTLQYLDVYASSLENYQLRPRTLFFSVKFIL